MSWAATVFLTKASFVAAADPSDERPRRVAATASKANVAVRIRPAAEAIDQVRPLLLADPRLDLRSDEPPKIDGRLFINICNGLRKRENGDWGRIDGSRKADGVAISDRRVVRRFVL